MTKTLIITCCVLLWTACSKNNEDKDTQSPSINLLFPTNNQVYNPGETIAVIGTIIDDKKVAEMHVHVSNNTTGALLIDIHRYPDVNYYMIDESFTAQAGIQYKVQIIAADQAGKQDTQSVLVSCN